MRYRHGWIETDVLDGVGEADLNNNVLNIAVPENKRISEAH